MFKIKEWEKVNLPKPSITRMKLATVSKSIIDKNIGGLYKKDIKTLKPVFIDFLS